jgi:hypothetical protein
MRHVRPFTSAATWLPFLAAPCEHLSTIRTQESYKNDLSYLRTFFGPVCEALKPGAPVIRPHAAYPPLVERLPCTCRSFKPMIHARPTTKRRRHVR